MDPAQKEKKEWEVELKRHSRFEKWKEFLQNLKKLINGLCLQEIITKIGLGFKEYFGKDEVFDLSTPSVFYPEPVEEDKPLYSCDKSSDSETYASCDSSLKTKTKDFPPTVDIKTLPESDVEDPNSTAGSPSFSCLENVKSPRIFCNKSGMNNRNVCKNNSVRIKKCFVCGSKLHLIKDCDFYNCVDSVPCKSKAASVPAGSRNSPASVTAGGSDPAASRNRPAVNSADRPNPAGWSKRPATVSAGRPVSAGWLNPAARPYFRPSSVYFNNMYWPDLYDPMYMNKGRWSTAGDPSTDNDIGIVDSGCSRSMTGNKEKLDDLCNIQGEALSFLKHGLVVMERNADCAKSLLRFKDQRAEILSHAEAEIRNQGVSADRDSAGIGSAGGVSAGSTSAGSDPAGSHPAGTFQPAGSYDPAALGDPAASTSVSADFIPVHADELV
ncbi:hypothetical protein Tco_0877363 [Tanacetum coccineum]|uniref:CCHC-type domain-containing protein n=1 Tax=Tanacetum coccineum TaxID=301880 RepID=A0ABQ5BXX5_9ASTR